MRGRQEEIAALGTSGNGNVVVKGVSSPEEVADIVIELRSGGSGRTPGIVGEVVVAGAGIFAGIVILVVHVTHQVLLLGFRKPGGPGTGVLAGEIHLHGAFLALFGVDNHHTGRCAGTVQGGGGGAFQDGHALDILGVDIHHTVGGGGGGVHGTVEAGIAHHACGVVVDDAVHHKQGLVVALQGGTATQDNLGTGTGRTGGLGDAHAGHLARQGVDGVCVLVQHEFIGPDFLNGIAKGLLFLADTQSGDNGFLQEFIVFFHRHHHACGGSHVNGGIADAGNFQHCAGAGRDGEHTITVRHGTRRSSLDDDTGTRNGHSLSINNSTGNPGLLLIGRYFPRRIGSNHGRASHQKGSSRACSKKFCHFHKKQRLVNNKFDRFGFFAQ